MFFSRKRGAKYLAIWRVSIATLTWECQSHDCERRGVSWVLAFLQLTCVVAADEEVNGPRQRVDAAREAAREAARAAAQAGKVMAQVGVDGLDRVSLRLVIHRPMPAPSAQLAVRVEGIAVIVLGARRGIHDRLRLAPALFDVPDRSRLA